MLRRWRAGRRTGAAPPKGDAAAALAVVEDAMGCAAELHALGAEIDRFRRKGEAMIGGNLGPEVQPLRERQNEIVQACVERMLRVKRDDPEALADARRLLHERYRETRGDIVTGRALELVEAALRRDEG